MRTLESFPPRTAPASTLDPQFSVYQVPERIHFGKVKNHLYKLLQELSHMYQMIIRCILSWTLFTPRLFEQRQKAHHKGSPAPVRNSRRRGCTMAWPFSSPLRPWRESEPLGTTIWVTGMRQSRYRMRNIKGKGSFGMGA